MAILTTLRKAEMSPFIFPSSRFDKPLSNMAMLMLLRRQKHTDITVLGFRSGFRDWCGDETDFPPEIAEAALAHKVGNAVELAYRRSNAIEKRRGLMQAWADYLTMIPLGAASVSKWKPA